MVIFIFSLLALLSPSVFCAHHLVSLNYSCYLKREGASHSLWINPKTGVIEAIPRHTEIKEFLAKKILKSLPGKLTLCSSSAVNDGCHAWASFRGQALQYITVFQAIKAMYVSFLIACQILAIF